MTSKRMVRFTSDLEAFTGLDGKEYGPFSKGDIETDIPKKQVELLLKKGVCKEIEMKPLMSLVKPDEYKDDITQTDDSEENGGYSDCIYPEDTIDKANKEQLIGYLNFISNYSGDVPDNIDSFDVKSLKELLYALNRDEVILDRIYGDDAKIRREAEEILKSGDPIEMFRKTFKTVHSGDVEVLDTILLAQCAQQTLTAQGIQPVLSGSSMAGKTSAVLASVHLTPPEYLISGDFSSKNLFYDQDLKPGCIIFSDDVELPNDILSTIKKAMSNFQQPTIYRTVTKEKGKYVGLTLAIPPRLIFMFTSVHDVGDDQLATRQYRISIEQTPENDKSFLKFTTQRMIEGREPYPVSHDVMVCREILRQVKKHVFRVKIPFADKLEFADISNKRNILMFFDHIMASAVLHFMQRDIVDEDGIQVLYATVEDFDIARRVFKANEETRKYDLTKAELALLDFIQMMGGEITEQDIIEKYSKGGKNKSGTRTKIKRLLNGRDNKGGLVDKVPGLVIVKENRRVGEEITRQVNVIKVPDYAKITMDDYGTWVTLEMEHEGNTSEELS